jgi:hypothetical protein
MLSTLGTCFSSSKIEEKALGKVGSKKEHALKLCNISPPSNSIMNFAPYMGISSKVVVVDFHDQNSNFCLLGSIPIMCTTLNPHIQSIRTPIVGN